MLAQSGATTEWSYTGEQHDPTALEYLRARYYDASTGRFTSRDPLPLLQRYAYVGNNPAMFVDPYGLCGKNPGSWGGCFSDAGKCVLRHLDCVDPRRLADPLIDLLPEGTALVVGGHPSAINS